MRKFADGREDNKLPALQEATREGSPPSQRMSAFKTNPVTLAQFSRMRGRGFLLSQVGEIEGPSIVGWFSSKLEHLCHLASDPPSPAPPSPRPGLLTIQIYWETEDTRGLNLEEYREKLGQAACGGDVEEKGGEKKDELYCSEDELELESTKKAVQRRLKRMLMLPAGWRQVRIGQPSIHHLSPFLARDSWCWMASRGESGSIHMAKHSGGALSTFH